MTLLKPLRNTSLLTPYEQYYIHSLHEEGKLIPEQCRGDPNPLLLLAIDPSQPLTWPRQSDTNSHTMHKTTHHSHNTSVSTFSSPLTPAPIHLQHTPQQPPPIQPLIHHPLPHTTARHIQTLQQPHTTCPCPPLHFSSPTPVSITHTMCHLNSTHGII